MACQRYHSRLPPKKRLEFLIQGSFSFDLADPVGLDIDHKDFTVFSISFTCKPEGPQWNCR